MTNSFSRIPEELKAISQWVVWRLEDIGAAKPTKVPYDPKSKMLEHASTDRPQTWGSFTEALQRLEMTGVGVSVDGIGFMFTDHDPYTFIDLDDPSKLPNGTPNPNHTVDLERQIKIFKEFDSYAEVSPSGTGLHIIVKGNVLAGRKRSFIEIYSSKRYATFTGNVYADKPIAYCQEVLTQLWEQMGAIPTTSSFKGHEKEILTDEQVLLQAVNAVNGEKFKALLEGNWQSIYPSQSEADFAFVDIVSFYSGNKQQIERLFKASPLGQRDKAKRADYIEWMISKSFDRQLPPIDFDGFKNALELKMAQQAASPQLSLPMGLPVIEQPQQKSAIPIPPGLLGELAHFIYQASPRPIPEIALAGSIGLMAGIAGRAYNVIGTGLNQYVILIANTGAGKEAIASGVDRIMNAIRQQVPTSTKFRGPAEMASGQALLKYLNKRSNCFVSILGEFGIRLSELSNPLAQDSTKKLSRMLLELFNKSGHGQTFQGNIYADLNENVDATFSPSISLIGESTPEKFYSVLNEDMIASGLLPRFNIIEYTGSVPYLNYGHADVKPPFKLVEQMVSLAANCETVMHANKVINVAFTEDADKISRDFERHCTDQINNAVAEVKRQLWNRAHLKSVRLAALIAVGINMYNPVITSDYLEWAIAMIKSDIAALMGRFEKGDVGNSSSESQQIEHVVKGIQTYFKEGMEKARTSYGISEILYTGRVVPFSYLTRRLMGQSVFRHDKLGPTVAIKRSIQTMIESDRLREVAKSDMVNRFGTSQRGFVVIDLAILG